MDIAELSNLLDKLRNELKADMEQVVTKAIDRRVEQLQQSQEKLYGDLKKENEILKVALEKQKQVISDMNRMNNVAFHGLDKNVVEKRVDLENKIVAVCKDKLQVDMGRHDVNWVRRLRKRGKQKNRPVLVSLVANSKNWDVLEISVKLKGSNIFLSNDYDEAERDRRRFLSQVRKLVSANGKECRWKNRGLVIDGQFLEYEEIKRKYEDAVNAGVSENNAEETVTPEVDDVGSARKRKRGGLENTQPLFINPLFCVK
ncbi:unnamed protein product [Bemisia tabaci]|uniref:Endonuclease-reverse transcriptase n=1 Tax=Bemisia tabaci TaxID=7038 RepID=A0A9P0A5M7_BEMTA|nr:unnamed protein product [Bemisia tabaci]